MIKLKEVPLPEHLSPYWRSRALAHRARVLDEQARGEMREKDGALWWVSNDHPVPLSHFRDGYLQPPPAQEGVVDRETARVFRAYREAQARHVPTPEEEAERMFELRAAFGEGTSVVDIITGKKTYIPKRSQ